jgi:CDGSH-type Zn-finger protein/uncharacterized Fe-S cluster protein YjdI
MTVETAEGRAVTIRFDGALCIHARRCVMGAPASFRANVQGPWIDADATDAEALMAVARNCPSGAITIARHDGGREETPPAANTVTVRENGPLAFHGDLSIEPAGAEPRRMTRATLCRCGLSRNKPFCDNSHIEGGFIATGEPEGPPSELTIPDLTGPVTIYPKPNGSLVVTGRLEVSSGTGRNVRRVEKAFFCRCGQSRNKPFCDGSHREAGFTAP